MERKKISNNVIWVFKMLVGRYKTKVARLLGLPYSPGWVSSTPFGIPFRLPVQL